MIPADHPLASRLYRQPSSRSVRVTLYGGDGIGKTTFGLDSPDPFFIAPEISKFPKTLPAVVPTSWADTFQIVRALAENPFGRKTVVIDTADFLYPYSVYYVCSRDNPGAKKPLLLEDGRPCIENYPYGTGPKIVAQEWTYLLGALDDLRARHGMNIIILAHVRRHKIRNTGGEDYDMLGPAVDRDTADLLCHWSDAVLFAELYRKPVIETTEKIKTHKTPGRTKMITDGARICWTQERQAHRAKNRDGIPEAIALSWHEFARYALADLEALQEQIDMKIEQISDAELTSKMRAYLTSSRYEAGTLLRVLERLDERLPKQG